MIPRKGKRKGKRYRRTCVVCGRVAMVRFPHQKTCGRARCRQEHKKRGRRARQNRLWRESPAWRARITRNAPRLMRAYRARKKAKVAGEEGVMAKQRAAKAKAAKKAPAEETPDAYAEGVEAFMAGRSDTTNPYPPATDEHLSWNDGYLSQSEGDDD